MASAEELSKDIVVAWLSNPAVMSNAQTILLGQDATQVGEFLATVTRSYSTRLRKLPGQLPSRAARLVAMPERRVGRHTGGPPFSMNQGEPALPL